MVADALAAFRLAEADADPFNRLIGADRYFSAACDAGEVSPLTLDGADLTLAPDDTAARIAALRDRLRRLGYPLADVAPEQRGVWTDELREMLRQFQIEASLAERSGELTVEAWDALQELFNFETRLHAADWFGADGPEIPLRRATRLRLSVLGFGDAPSPEDFEPEPASLTAFGEILSVLGILDTALDAMLTPAFAQMVFGHDALADRLADCGPALAGLSGRSRERASHFLVCFAKIELWLHGYDVVPDGGSSLVQPSVHGPHASVHVERANRTADQFNLFFAELAPEGVSIRSAAPAAIPARVPELLQRMRALRASQSLSKEAASGEIVAALEAELGKKPALWADLKTAAAQLTSILFDGVRRVFAWLGRLLSHVWSAASTAAVNMWRAVHHFTGGAAFYFRKAARALGEGVAFLTSPGVASVPVCCAGYSRRIDFDAGLLIDDDAEEDEVRIFTRLLSHKGATLAIACRIIRLVCVAVRVALSGAAGAVGGFVPMVLGLASVWSQLRVLGRLLDALPDET